MTEKYKFKDWVLIAHEKHPTDGDLFWNEVKCPALPEFIDHHLEELRKAYRAGLIEDHRWDKLQDCVTNAIEALKMADVAAIAKAFYDLGRAREEVDHHNSEDMIDLYETKIKSLKREAPLFRLNLGKKHLKETAQYMAEKEWEKDTRQEIRLGSMCKKVYSIIFNEVRGDDLEKALPREPMGLKEWLRPIAPSWAKKGGRPRK